MQTKKNSFKEACINTLVGFLVTLLFSPLIYAMCGIKTSPSQLGLATLYFTILSIARGYVIRRFFNNKGTGGLRSKEKKVKSSSENSSHTCSPHDYVKVSGGHICQYCGDTEGKF